MNYIITTPATVEPLTLAEVKMHLRVDSDYEDAMIQAYMVAARSHCERFTGLSFVEQGIKLVEHKVMEIALPLSPVASIASVKDGAGNDVQYTADLDAIPATIEFDSEQEKVIVQYTTSAQAITPDIKLAVMMLIHQMYEHRGEMEKESVERVEEAYLRAHRVALGFA